MPQFTDEHPAMGHSTQPSVKRPPLLGMGASWKVLFLSPFTVFFLKSKWSYHDPVDGFLPPRLRETEFNQMLFLFLRVLDRSFGFIPVTLGREKNSGPRRWLSQ